MFPLLQSFLQWCSHAFWASAGKNYKWSPGRFSNCYPFLPGLLHTSPPSHSGLSSLLSHNSLSELLVSHPKSRSHLVSSRRMTAQPPDHTSCHVQVSQTIGTWDVSTWRSLLFMSTFWHLATHCGLWWSDTCRRFGGPFVRISTSRIPWHMNNSDAKETCVGCLISYFNC